MSKLRSAPELWSEIEGYLTIGATGNVICLLNAHTAEVAQVCADAAERHLQNRGFLPSTCMECVDAIFHVIDLPETKRERLARVIWKAWVSQRPNPNAWSQWDRVCGDQRRDTLAQADAVLAEQRKIDEEAKSHE